MHNEETHVKETVVESPLGKRISAKLRLVDSNPLNFVFMNARRIVGELYKLGMRFNRKNGVVIVQTLH